MVEKTNYPPKLLKMTNGRVCKYCGKSIEVMKIQMPFLLKKEKSFKLRCECVLEHQKKKERRYKYQEMMKILQERGFQTGKYAHMTLSNWHDNNVDINVVGIAKNYIKSVELYNKNWLYMYGEYGVGKTHIGVATARQIALVHQWVPALFRWAEFCSKIQQSWNDVSIKVDWDPIRSARILVLDDIDKKPASHWTLDKLYDVLDYRYINNLPTIITANRSISELSVFWNKNNQTEELSMAIISRIVGQLVKVVHFKGYDCRLCNDKG